jgi:hypothetical protein
MRGVILEKQGDPGERRRETQSRYTHIRMNSAAMYDQQKSKGSPVTNEKTYR